MVLLPSFQHVIGTGSAFTITFRCFSSASLVSQLEYHMPTTVKEVGSIVARIILEGRLKRDNSGICSLTN
jgi:hypothetical protein